MTTTNGGKFKEESKKLNENDKNSFFERGLSKKVKLRTNWG